MRWYRAVICKREEIGADAMGCPVLKLSETSESVLVRSAPWTAQPQDVEGNRHDMVSRTFLTKADAGLLEDADAIKVKGSVYEIDGVVHDSLTTMIRTRRCKDEI